MSRLWKSSPQTYRRPRNPPGSCGTGSAACDVSNAEAMEKAALTLTEELGGPIHTVVANAGKCVSGRLAEDPVESLVGHFQVNTLGVLNTFRPHIASMRDSGRRSLIAITSNCAHKPRCDLGAYCASKAATKMKVECLALELSPGRSSAQHRPPTSIRRPHS
jgi:2,3-dihydro-2,3-dihydroxybenzoate dehydrogenase